MQFRKFEHVTSTGQIMRSVCAINVYRSMQITHYFLKERRTIKKTDRNKI